MLRYWYRLMSCSNFNYRERPDLLRLAHWCGEGLDAIRCAGMNGGWNVEMNALKLGAVRESDWLLAATIIDPPLEMWLWHTCRPC